MKVLISAMGCTPYHGSEGYVGWSAVQCLARDHDLRVITSPRNRADLERAAAEGLTPKNVQFAYAGKPRKRPLNSKLQSWVEYIEFNKAILPTAQSLHKNVGFDLAHHITIATWRVPSPLWKLGIPFIFGPVGGTQQFPLGFLSILSPAAAAFELMRMVSNTAGRSSSSVRSCVQHAAHVFASTPETEQLIAKLRGSPAGVSMLMQTFFSEEKMRLFTQHANLKSASGPLRIFGGGSLLGSKGIAMAFQALVKAKAKGVAFQYRVGGVGPELSHLQKLARRLGLEQEVIFGIWRGEEYRKELGASHIYLLPSLREGAPVTLMEAMLAGCVPVVADCGGPSFIVSEVCGFRIPVTDPRRLVDDLATAIVAIDRRREIIPEKGQAAAKRIEACFTEENYRKVVNSVYSRVTNQRGNQVVVHTGSPQHD